MTEYRVVWRIDVEADTPEDAARAARDMQLDPTAQVGYFRVKWDGGECGVDLTPGSA